MISKMSLNEEIRGKILDFLKQHYPRDYNIQEIADAIEIHRNTVSTYIKVMIAAGDIKESRRIGSAIMVMYADREK